MGPNRTFALNVFGWMMDQIIPSNVPPPPPPPETYFPLQSPIRVYDSRLTEGAIPSGREPHRQGHGRHGGRHQRAGGRHIGRRQRDGRRLVRSRLPDGVSVGPAPPTISTHNFGKGENFANTVVMGVSNGNISVLNQFYNNGAGGTQVLVDVIGYSRSVTGGSHMRTMAPVRALDSRVGTGTTERAVPRPGRARTDDRRPAWRSEQRPSRRAQHDGRQRHEHRQLHHGLAIG